jgi:hypothetical protein
MGGFVVPFAAHDVFTVIVPAGLPVIDTVPILRIEPVKPVSLFHADGILFTHNSLHNFTA